jgi:SAM-dependent methyltransferase
VDSRDASDEAAAFKHFEAEGWTARAESYEQLTGRASAASCEALLDAAAVAAGARVLDVASGPGHISAAIAARAAQPTGIDISEGMLSAARSQYPQLEFLHGDAEALPFSDSAFDAVVGGFVLNHLPAPERAVAEAARVVRPGGKVAFAVWDRPERTRMIGLISDAIDHAGADRSAGPPPGPDGFRFADEHEFTTLLAGARLEQVGVDTVELVVPVPGGVDELWEGLLGGSVRASSVVLAQPKEVRRRIRAAFDQLAAEHRSADGGLAVPAVVKIGSGRCP